MLRGSGRCVLGAWAAATPTMARAPAQRVSRRVMDVLLSRAQRARHGGLPACGPQISGSVYTRLEACTPLRTANPRTRHTAILRPHRHEETVDAVSVFATSCLYSATACRPSARAS